MNRESEKALVEQARSGCPVSLNRLLDGCYAKLLATAKSILGNHEDARDAAQEAAILVFERIHQLEDPGAFAGWSGMIVRRSCIRLIRRRERQDGRRVSLDDVPCASEISEISQPEDRIHVGEVLGHLEKPMIEIVELRLLLGFSVRETAARLDISEGAVKTRLHRVRRKALAFAEQAVGS